MVGLIWFKLIRLSKHYIIQVDDIFHRIFFNGTNVLVGFAVYIERKLNLVGPVAAKE